MARRLAHLVSLLPLLLAGQARAAGEAALDVRWRAPAGCPPEQAIRAEVERLVGHPVPAGDAPTLRADADVSGVEGAWRVRLRTSAGGAKGEKWLEAPSCRSLADAVALVVALAYDPQALASTSAGGPLPGGAAVGGPPQSAGAGAGRPPPGGAAAGSPRGVTAAAGGSPRGATAAAGGALQGAAAAGGSLPGAAAAGGSLPGAEAAGGSSSGAEAAEGSPQALTKGAEALPASVGPAAASADRASKAPAQGGGPSLRPSVHVAFVANAGALPALAPGFSVGASLASSRSRFEAAASVWSEQSARLAARSPAPTPGGDFELWALGGKACYVPEGRPIGLDVCALGEVGRMSGRGVGVAQAGGAWFLWGALGAGLTAHWAFAAHLGLRASVEGLVPIARPTFVLEPLGEVYRPSAVTGRASLGAEASF